MLTVSQDVEGVDIAPVFAERGLERLEQYRDNKNELGFAFGTGMLPTTVLYDAEGKEVWRVIGGMDWTGPRANTLLAFLNSAGAHGASIPADAQPANLERYVYQFRLGPDAQAIKRLLEPMHPDQRRRWTGTKSARVTRP